MSHSLPSRRLQLLRLLAEAAAVGMIVGLTIIWLQGGFHTEAAPASYANAVSRAAPAVVNIYTTREISGNADRNNLNPFFQEPRQQRLQASLGSGVIVSKTGYILTSYHVIKQANAILVALADGRESEASIIGIDPATDLALLQIHLPNLTPIELDRSKRVRVGDVVLAIGNPLGVGQTASMGIVGATGRSHLGISTFEDFIQTDAAINKGNSGGALIDTNGDLVGINTAILSSDGRWQGIGFATPVAIAAEVMQDIITHGHVIRGYLGISLQDLTAQQAASLGLTTPHGGIVTGILRASPAAMAGIRPGDLLLGINGSPVRDGYDAMNRVANTKPGSQLTVDLLRNGRSLSLPVTVTERPQGMDSQD